MLMSGQVTGHVDDRLDDTIRMVCYEVKWTRVKVLSR